MNQKESAGWLGKILIIDDEEDLLKGLKDTLIKEHFHVITATTGTQGLQKAGAEHPDAIILDLRLPDMDGYTVCTQMRQRPETKETPILILSTRSQTTDKVVGLEIGADDYLTKPFHHLELLARLKALLRRAKDKPRTQETPLVLKSNEVTLNTESRRVLVGSTDVRLTKKEFDLLVVFLSKPGKVYNRSFLLEAVWGMDVDSLQATVDTHIKSLRKKLGRAGAYLETLKAVGYRWNEKENLLEF
jgi:DNA-binding response OmpR family regulator